MIHNNAVVALEVMGTIPEKQGIAAFLFMGGVLVEISTVFKVVFQSKML